MALLKIEMTEWCGLPRAKCPLCPIARVGDTEADAKAQIKAHMWERHIAEVEAHRAEAAAMKATLYDADGKLIDRMPLADDAAFADLKQQIQEN